MSISSKPNDLKKVNFTTITEEGEIENDKQRILKKFNFLSGNNIKQIIANTDSNENNSNDLINQSQIFYNQSITENKKDKNNYNTSERNILNSILNFNLKYNTAQNTTSANSVQTSNRNLKKKEKNIKNNKKIIINKIIYPKKIKKNTIKLNLDQLKISNINNNNKIKININQNINSIYPKKEEKADEIDSDSNTKKESSRELNFKTKNILSGDFDVKDSDSFSGLHQNQSFHNNNRITDNNDEDENENNLNLISPYQKNYNSKKYLKLFDRIPSYIVSNRFINDEVNKYNIINQNKNYKFISKIREENQQIIQLNIKSFLKLSDYSLYCLLSFCYEIYNDLILHTNKFISGKINLVLNNLFEKPISSFSNVYKNHFKLINYYFTEKTFKKNKKNYSLINLVIQSQIITKEKNKTIEFGYNFILNQKEYNNIWIIDIKKKDKIKIWISCELESYNHFSKRFCYTSPISTFSNNDSFQLDITIYSQNGAIEPNSIEWTNPIISETTFDVFEKKYYGTSIPFDPLRACEIENMVHLWKSEYEIKNNSLIKEFKKIFGKKFNIKNITFDISKFYFYKIQMNAANIGKIQKNNFTHFDIDIIPYESELLNEIQSIGLLNTVHYLKSFKIRVGMEVIFYLIDVQ